ncbi:MAG: WG repeat-containing protein [Flavobacteriales bacterium]|nr:WG repeat-containing protein [Flavobacteriales bacterium]
MNTLKCLFFTIIIFNALIGFAQDEEHVVLPVKIGKKWGFINNQGAIVIEPTYRSITEFKKGFCVVNKNNKVGMVNSQGKEVVEPNYAGVRIINENLFGYYRDSLWGIAGENGKLTGELYHELKDFNRGKVLVKKDTLFGLVNLAGRELIPVLYDKIERVDSNLFYAHSGKFWAVYNEYGLVIADTITEIKRVKKHNHLVIKVKDEWKIIDGNGRIKHVSTKLNVEILNDNFVIFQGDELGSLYSVLGGKMISQDEVNKFKEFDDNRVMVGKGKLWGLIDNNGEAITTISYTQIIKEQATNNLRVRENMLWGLLDYNGKVLCKPQFQQMYWFQNGVTIVKNEHQGILNQSGKIIVALRYDYIDMFKETAKCFVKSGDINIVTFSSEGELISDDNYGNVITIKIGVGRRRAGLSTSRFIIPLGDFEWYLDADIGKYGLRVVETRAIKIPPIYKNVNVNYGLGLTVVMVEKTITEGTLEVRKANYGLVNNKHGQQILSPTYKKIFLEDLRFNTGNAGVFRATTFRKRYSLINRRGKVVKSGYKLIDGFKDGVARCLSTNRRGEYWKLVDGNGEFIKIPLYSYLSPIENGLLIAQKANRWGVIDTLGIEVINFLYDHISYLSGSNRQLFRLTCKQNKYGYLDQDKEEQVNVNFSDIKAESEGLIPVKKFVGPWHISKFTKWGFANTQGELVLPHQFDNVGIFSEGLAYAKKGSKWGYINKKGDWVIEPIYTKCSNFNGNTAWVRDGATFLFINKAGEQIFSQQFQSVESYIDTVAIAKLDGKKGLINLNGETLVDFKYDKIFSTNEPGVYIVRKKGKYGLISSSAEKITPLRYDKLLTFSEGRVAFRKDNKYGYLDNQGNVIVENIYLKADEFSEGKARVKIQGKYGFVNIEGTEVVAPQYTYAKSFHEGRAVVGMRSRQHVINDSFEAITSTKANVKISNFNEGKAVVTSGKSLNHYINSKGEKLYCKIFSNATNFVNNKAMIKINGKWTVMDNNGLLLMMPIYDNIDVSEDGSVIVSSNESYGIANLEGKIIIEPDYLKVFNVKKGLYAVMSGDKMGYISDLGEWIWSPDNKN